MSSTRENAEFEFVHQIRRALDESAVQLPPATLDRLAAARRAALSRKKPEAAVQREFAPAFAGAGFGRRSGRAGETARRPGLLSRFGVLLPVVAIAAVLFAVVSWEEQRHVSEIADIDAAMLTDDLPLSAYLDHGFHAYLSRAR